MSSRPEPIDHKLKQFEHLPLNILRRYTNVDILVADEHKKRNGIGIPNFVLRKQIEKYHSAWESCDFDLLEQLKFVTPTSGVLINAAIWSLSEQKRSEVYNSATEHQRKFIYLPLHVFREATNIYQLLREKNRGNISNVNTLARQIHIDLINIKSWPIFLSGLKFLDDETIQSVEISGRSGSMKSNSSVHSDRSSRKRKESSSQQSVCSMSSKKDKVELEVPIIKASRLKHTNSESKSSDCSAKPSTSKEVHDEQLSQVSQKDVSISKKKPVLHEPSDFQLEVIALTFEEFVERTNIKELVAQDFAKQFNGSMEMTPAALQMGLQEYDRLRNQFDKWHLNLLKNLKFKVCKCKRNTTFNEMPTQTDDVSIQDKEVQYNVIDFGGNADMATQTETPEVQEKEVQYNVIDFGGNADMETQTEMPEVQEKEVQYDSLDFNGNIELTEPPKPKQAIDPKKMELYRQLKELKWEHEQSKVVSKDMIRKIQICVELSHNAN